MPARSSPKKRPAKSAGWLEKIRGAPPWLSAVAAITGTLITAIGVFGLVGGQRAPQTQPPPSVVLPRVTIESLLVGEQQVEADGLFEFLDPQSQEIVFIGRPAAAESTDLWVAVEAALLPSQQVGSLQSGEWSASRPAPPPAPYRWRAIVMSNAAGATAIEDLKINGPDSRYVISRSDEWLEP